jgi:hypothetical protein
MQISQSVEYWLEDEREARADGLEEIRQTRASE